MSDESHVVPINLASKSAHNKETRPLYNEEGEQIGMATLECEITYSRVIQAGEDTYLMVDEKNWDVARGRFPWKMTARTLPVTARKLGMAMVAKTDYAGYVLIEIGEHMFVVPERHTEALCRMYPQNP